jgi:hypothetical protein
VLRELVIDFKLKPAKCPLFRIVNDRTPRLARDKRRKQKISVK